MSSSSSSATAPSRAPEVDYSSRTNPIDADAPILSGGVSEILHSQSYIPGSRYYSHSRTVEYIAGSLPLIMTVPHGGYDSLQGMSVRLSGTHEHDIQTQELIRFIHEEFIIQTGDRHLIPHIVIARLRRSMLDMNRNEKDSVGWSHDSQDETNMRRRTHSNNNNNNNNNNNTNNHTNPHAESDALKRRAWREFHAFVRRAKREIVRGRSSVIRDGTAASMTGNTPPAAASSVSSSPSHYHRGLVLDLHGQSHDRRHQLGYMLNQQDLAEHTDQQLDHSQEMRDKASVRCAVLVKQKNGAVASAAASSDASSPFTFTPLSSLIRGPTSLGALLESLGHACVPSSTSPHAHIGYKKSEKKIMYFNGGYNTGVNGSAVVGQQQREKERAEDEAMAASTTSATTTLIASSSSSSTFPDPDPVFTSFFNSTLEHTAFLSIQLESAYEGQRDNEENMKKFARNLVKALLMYMNMHVLKKGESLPKPTEEAAAATTIPASTGVAASSSSSSLHIRSANLLTDFPSIHAIFLSHAKSGETLVFDTGDPDFNSEVECRKYFFGDIKGAKSFVVIESDQTKGVPPESSIASSSSSPSSASTAIILGVYRILPNQPGRGSHIANASYLVSPHAQGRGVGRMMGQYSILQARSQGYHAIQFNYVISTNTVAVKLWKSLGFQIVATLKGAYRHVTKGLVDAYVMYQVLEKEEKQRE